MRHNVVVSIRWMWFRSISSSVVPTVALAGFADESEMSLSEIAPSDERMIAR